MSGIESVLGVQDENSPRRLLFTVLVLLVTVTVLVSAVAAVPFVAGGDFPSLPVGSDSTGEDGSGGDAASGATASATDSETFESFSVNFSSTGPEEPTDVVVRWRLASNATDVDKVRVEIANDSRRAINVYRPGGAQIRNPFTVSEGGGRGDDASIVVDDLSNVEVTLKIPPGHCGRVDQIEVRAFGGDRMPIEPDIRRSQHCANVATDTFDVGIQDYDETVTAGETVDVVATVENVGGAAGSQDVRLLVDGTEQGRTNLTLDPGENRTVTFTYETTDSDVGNLDVAVESDDDAANRTVTVAEPPFFAVSIADAPATVAAGQPIEVTAQVHNTGGTGDAQNVTLAAFDGQVVDVDESLELGADESTTVTLLWETDGTDVGDGPVTVSSANDTDTATVEITDPAVESITATLNDSTINATEQTSIVVEATYTDGSTRTVTENATLVANNSTVATVSSDGTVAALEDGQTTIEATFENQTGSDTLTVGASDGSGPDSGSNDGSGSENGSEGSSDGTSSGGSGSSGDSGSDGGVTDGSGDSTGETGPGGGSGGAPTAGGGSSSGGGGTIVDPGSADDGSDPFSDDGGAGTDSGPTSPITPDDETSSGDDQTGDDTVDTDDSTSAENDSTDREQPEGEDDERTTIVFLPALGLLLLPILLFAVPEIR